MDYWFTNNFMKDYIIGKGRQKTGYRSGIWSAIGLRLSLESLCGFSQKTWANTLGSELRSKKGRGNSKRRRLSAGELSYWIIDS